MHEFPKDANLRRQWEKFVQVKRAKFVESTEHICNILFLQNITKKVFMLEMGLRKQSLRLSGAIPTIQSSAVTKIGGKGASDLVYTTLDGSQLGQCLPR